MELQIQDLVTSIRREGLDAAKVEAESIISEAKKKAESIVSGVKTEAQQYKDSAEKEIAVLAFETEIKAVFERILASGVRKELSGEGLGKLIRAAVSGENLADYAAEVAEVTEELKKELADEIKNGLEIRPAKNVQHGFRLASKDGSGYFDCSEDGIMEMLTPYFREPDFR